MFYVIEFNKSCGGGLAIVREEWLTSRNKECFWPPFKNSEQYNKCLLNDQDPSEDWTLFPIGRIFYSTDDVPKARKILKVVSESELITEEEELSVRRKRKPTKRFMYTDDEDSSDGDIPSTDVIKIPKLSYDFESSIYKKNKRSSVNSPVCRVSELLEETSYYADTSSSNQLTDVFHQIASSPILRQSAIIPKSSHQDSNALNSIAKALTRVEKRLIEIEKTNKLILNKLGVNDTISFVELPSEINLPCESLEDINKLEEFLMNGDNLKTLIEYLSVLGGKNLAITVRQILKKVFSNQVAIHCNWTGKNSKYPLKNLTITKIIPGIVRRNKTTMTATDEEIYGVLVSWFRFSKDRDGGRYHRRKKNV